MIDKKTQKAFNDQIQAELFSAYLYMSMSAWFFSQNLTGFAHWMKVQWGEELAHAMKFFEHIVQRGGKVELKAIDAPPLDWSSPLALFKAVAAHERKVTSLINGLMDAAIKANDHASVSFLRWFVDEQVEEEANADAIVQKLTMAEGHTGVMLMMDHELAGRGKE